MSFQSLPGVRYPSPSTSAFPALSGLNLPLPFHQLVQHAVTTLALASAALSGLMRQTFHCHSINSFNAPNFPLPFHQLVQHAVITLALASAALSGLMRQTFHCHSINSFKCAKLSIAIPSTCSTRGDNPCLGLCGLERPQLVQHSMKTFKPITIESDLTS